MSKLLYVKSSIFQANSKSAQIADEFVREWSRHHPLSEVVVRDLGTTPLPHIDAGTFAAFFKPADARSPEEKKNVAAADALIDELEAADSIVIASPMYNFTISSNLKAWIDRVARAGRTFRYTEKGPEGLLKNKKVFVVTGRGGVYSEGPMNSHDFQEPYLRAVLGFLGLKDISFIHIEGLNISPDHAEKGLARARQSVRGLVPAAQAA